MAKDERGPDEAIGEIAEAMTARATVSAAVDPGPHAVRIADRSLRDEARGATLQVRLYYPALAEGAGPEPLPAVIFSHGLGGSRLGYAYVGRSWASHGFISIHPSHEGSGADLLRAGRLEALRALKDAVQDPATWERRARDVSFLLGAVPSLEDLVPALQGRVDARRLAVAGHSFGAYTALLVSGAAIRLAGGRAAWGDPRCRAAVALSPPGPGDRGLDEAAFAAIGSPVLSLTGSEDLGLRGQPAAWREEGFAAMAAGGGHALVVIEGAEHFTFSGGRPRRPAERAQLRAVEQTTRAFLSTRLFDGAGPQCELRSLASPGVRIEEK
jgi:predicted dienelactone hydrolase